MNLDEIKKYLCDWTDVKEEGIKKGVILVQFKEHEDGVEIDGCIAGRRGTLIEGVSLIYNDHDRESHFGEVLRAGVKKATAEQLAEFLTKIASKCEEKSNEEPEKEQEEADK